MCSQIPRPAFICSHKTHPIVANSNIFKAIIVFIIAANFGITLDAIVVMLVVSIVLAGVARLRRWRALSPVGARIGLRARSELSLGSGFARHDVRLGMRIQHSYTVFAGIIIIVRIVFAIAASIVVIIATIVALLCLQGSRGFNLFEA